MPPTASWLRLAALSPAAALEHPLLTGMALLMVVAVITLVAWALQLMQSAIERREFSLMLAGCMVCSAAVGLASVMVITFSSDTSLLARTALWRDLSGMEEAAGVSLDAVALPEWNPEEWPLPALDELP